MSPAKKISLLVSAAGVVTVIIMAPHFKPGPQQLIAEDNARQAEVLAAARDAARQIDGSPALPSYDDVQALLGSDFQLTGGDYTSMGGGRTVYLFEVSDAGATHHACLSVDATYEAFAYTIKASAGPGAC